MTNDNDDNDLTYIDDEDEESGFRRWMSFVVVLFAIGGFFALAWYAYHAGTNNTNPEEVPLIEADNSPLKEAPADPGGQQFPHQDKTVYDAIAGNKTDSQSVERVLPAPEEPVNTADASSPAPNNTVVTAPVENMTTAATPATTTNTTVDGTAAVSTSAEPGKAKVITIEPSKDANTTTATAAPVASVETAKTETTTTIAPLAVAPAAEPVKTASIEKPAATTTKKTTLDAASVKKLSDTAPSAGNAAIGRVQLGAFRSAEEAKQSWNKMLKTNSSVLNGKTYSIQKADLGSKGTYYRLRVLNVANAKELCSQLSSKGQQCMVVK